MRPSKPQIEHRRTSNVHGQSRRLADQEVDGEVERKGSECVAEQQPLGYNQRHVLQSCSRELIVRLFAIRLCQARSDDIPPLCTTLQMDIGCDATAGCVMLFLL